MGKYGIGTKMIMLPIKLTSKIPRYPKLSKNVKRLSILLIKYTMTLHSPIYLVGKSRSISKPKSRVYENLRWSFFEESIANGSPKHHVPELVSSLPSQSCMCESAPTRITKNTIISVP